MIWNVLCVLDINALADRYACRMCHKSYSAKGSLARHNKYECPFNSAIVEFRCPYCNHSSRRKDHLKCHILTHVRVEKSIKAEKQ